MSDGPHGLAPGFILPGFGDLPVGAVVPFAGALGPPDALPSSSSPPAPAVGTTWPIEAWGWTACDGRTLPVASYFELFAALGYLYGGSGDSFALPDYRGYFLRGVDGGRNVDRDAGKRTGAPGGEADGVGSTQGFALQGHEHNYLEAQPSGPGDQGADAGAPGTTTVKTQGGPVAASGQPPVQVSPNETRPVNIYVNFIIKFTGGLWPFPFDALGERSMEHGL